jgi:hypothetical protein
MPMQRMTRKTVRQPVWLWLSVPASMTVSSFLTFANLRSPSRNLPRSERHERPSCASLSEAETVPGSCTLPARRPAITTKTLTDTICLLFVALKWQVEWRAGHSHAHLTVTGIFPTVFARLLSVCSPDGLPRRLTRVWQVPQRHLAARSPPHHLDAPRARSGGWEELSVPRSAVSRRSGS